MKKILYTLIISFVAITFANAQSGNAPILQLNPDANSAGYGDAFMGEARTMFVYTNPTSPLYKGNMVFASYSMGKFASINDQSQMLNAVSLGTVFMERHSISFGFRMLGGLKFQTVNEYGDYGKLIKPQDMTFDFSYAFRFTDNISAYVSGGLIQSKIYSTASTGYFGLGAYYRDNTALGSRDLRYNVGLGISNLGGQLKFGRKNNDLPRSFDIGGSAETDLADGHKLGLNLTSRYYFPSDNSYFTTGVGLNYTMYDMVSVRAGYQMGDGLNYLTVGAAFMHKYGDLYFSYVHSSSEVMNKMMRVGVSLRF